MRNDRDVMMNFEPGEYIRTMIFQSVTQAAQKKKVWVLPTGVEPRGGSRGRVQGVCTPPSWDDLWFSNTAGILPKKKLCGLLVLK